MLRKPLALVLVGVGMLSLSAPPAYAQTGFPGAGFVVRGLTGMATTFTVPRISCATGENSIVIIGLMGPSVGTLDGWNAAVVVGCNDGRPWSRMQTWVNAVGGGHAVGTAKFGNVVQCRLINAGTKRPLIQVTNESTTAVLKRYLAGASTTAVAGAYAGGSVTKFADVAMKSMGNHKPISKLDHTRKVEERNGVVLIGSSHLNSDGYHHKLYWRHH